MKRYLAFCGDNYYPAGGMEDFIGDFDDRADAERAVLSYMRVRAHDWGHIYDTEVKEIVHDF